MIKHLLIHILLITMVILVGCNIKKDATKISDEACDTLKIETRYSQKLTQETPVFIADSFANKAADAFTMQSLLKNHPKMLPLRKEPFRNIHNSSRIDTIYHFSGSRDTIKFYRSREKDFMIYFHLTSPELYLDSCVHPGMSKTTFRSIFGINRPVGNTIQLANSDGTLRYIFHFRDDALARIKSDFYFE